MIEDVISVIVCRCQDVQLSWSNRSQLLEELLLQQLPEYARTGSVNQNGSATFALKMDTKERTC
jgi:hypothetical protein